MTTQEPKIGSADGNYRNIAKQLILGVILAISIEFFLLGLHSIGAIRKIEDIGADLFLLLYQPTALESSSQSYVLIDIDEFTYEQWGYPSSMPWSNITSILTQLINSHPPMILVDIALPRSGSQLEGIETILDLLPQGEADSSKLKEPSKTTKRNFTQIIFMKDISPESRSAKSILPIVRKSVLELDIDRQKNLHWSSAIFNISQDGAIRYFDISTLACADGRAELIPSFALLASTLLGRSSPPTPSLEGLRSEISCIQPLESISHIETMSTKKELVELIDQDQSQRILYRIPWTDRTSTDSSCISASGPLVESPSGASPLVYILRAQCLLEYSAEQPDLQAILQDRIVVIGASFQDSRDVFETPLGSMPGSYIIINSLHSLFEFGRLGSPSLKLSVFLAGSQIFIIVLVFHFLRHHRALVVGLALLLVYALYFVAGIQLLQFGVWIDASLATLAIIAHRTLLPLEDRLGRPIQRGKANEHEC